MLKIDKLSLSYKNKKVINEASLDVDYGTIIGLLGANGSGKSTLLSAIAGVKKPDSGDVLLDDLSLRIRPGEYIAITGKTGCGKSTLMRIMRNYLAKYVPDYRETAGREEAAQAAKESFAGIFRYQEGHEPHFISFVRQPDGRFRFFNVTDGLEDSVMSMEDFAAGHLLRGTVIALTADENTRERKDAP